MTIHGWNKLIGHDWATAALAAAITHDRVGHAYLITGTEHIGKETLARLFAQALNCENEDVPCGHCRSCTLIENGRHPDIHIVRPAVSERGKKTLKIDAIRQLQRDLSLTAYEAAYKVAILPDFDGATIGASNAFLKTLEEPPPNVILLLTASDADTLLTTITSRCRVINLRPVPTALIEESLVTRWHIPSEKARLLAHLADGRLGWAVNAAMDTAVLTNRQEHLALLHDALDGSRVARFAIADKLAKKAEQLPALLQTWLSWWRDATILAQKEPSPILSNIDEQEQMISRLSHWQKNIVFDSLKETDRALWALRRNANGRLLIENLLLAYPKK